MMLDPKSAVVTMPSLLMVVPWIGATAGKAVAPKAHANAPDNVPYADDEGSTQCLETGAFDAGGRRC